MELSYLLPDTVLGNPPNDEADTMCSEEGQTSVP